MSSIRGKTDILADLDALACPRQAADTDQCIAYYERYLPLMTELNHVCQTPPVVLTRIEARVTRALSSLYEHRARGRATEAQRQAHHDRLPREGLPPD
jgi:hypothetical protein